MSRALLIGNAPPMDLGCTYVDAEPFDTVLIGSLTLGELLCFRDERVLAALAQGKSVVLYTPGLPAAEKNRALAARIASACRELKSLGVVFSDGSHKRLVTAQEARAMRMSGRHPEPGAVLTPLAREILEGLD